MFLVKAFRVHVRQPLSIRPINVDMTLEVELYLWIHAVLQCCLPYSLKILISRVKRRSPENGVVHYIFTNAGPAYANPIVIPRILIYFTDRIFYLKPTIT